MVNILKVVCPPAEELGQDVKTNIPCTEQNCDKIFQHQAALKLHLIKSHKLIEDEKDLRLYSSVKRKDIMEVHFHCPVKTCKYNVAFKKYFAKYSYLRQHYMKVHAEKKYSCVKCGHTYPLQRMLKSHQDKCSIVFRCKECAQQFDSKDLLQRHCDETSHRFMFSQHSRENLRREPRIDHSSTSIQTTSDKIKSSTITTLLTNTASISHAISSVTNTSIKPDVSRCVNRVTSRDKTTSLPTDLLKKISAQTMVNKTVTTGIKTASNSSQSLSKVSKITQNTAANLSNSGQPFSKVFKNSSTDSSNSSPLLSKVSKIIRNTATGTVSNSQQSPMYQNSSIVKFIEVPENEHSGKRKLCPIMPKLQTSPLVLVTPSDSKSQVSIINQNFIITVPEETASKQRLILPKVARTELSGLSSTVSSNLNSVTNIYNDSATIGDANLKGVQDQLSTSVYNIAFDKTNEQNINSNPKIGQKRSSGTQTGHHRKKYRKVAETQTPGDHILKKAMMTAHLPIVKQSTGSQVSPRARSMEDSSAFQNSETQTLSEYCSVKLAGVRKKKKKSKARCDFSANTNLNFLNPLPSTETQTHISYPDNIHGKSRKLHQQHPVSVNNTNLFDNKSVLESIATQTKDSFLTTSGFAPMSIDPALTTRTLDSEIQTKLKMNMSFKHCDTGDLLSLQQLGIENDCITQMGPNKRSTPVSSKRGSDSSVQANHQQEIIDTIGLQTSQPTPKPQTSSSPSSYLGVRNEILPQLNEKSQIFAQADSAIDFKIAEFERNAQTVLNDTVFAPLDDLSQDSLTGNKIFLDSGVQCSVPSTVTGVQTSTSVNDLALPNFLSTEVQTSTFDNPFNISAETQTNHDDILSDFLTHMQTQTGDELWANLGLSDIQTQTTDPCYPYSPTTSGGQCAVNVQTQTQNMVERVTVGLNTIDSHETQVQNNNTVDFSTQSFTAGDEHSVSMDIQTQTIFDENVIDSHTQTSWKDLMKMMKEAEKQ